VGLLFHEITNPKPKMTKIISNINMPANSLFIWEGELIIIKENKITLHDLETKIQILSCAYYQAASLLFFPSGAPLTLQNAYWQNYKPLIWNI